MSARIDMYRRILAAMPEDEEVQKYFRKYVKKDDDRKLRNQLKGDVVYSAIKEMDLAQPGKLGVTAGAVAAYMNLQSIGVEYVADTRSGRWTASGVSKYLREMDDGILEHLNTKPKAYRLVSC